MRNFKKFILLSFICATFLFSQKVFAQTASNIADKCINYTAKATYYVTKYTLKTGWFLIKKTAKGTVEVSKSIAKGTIDAFKKNNTSLKIKPVDNKSINAKTNTPDPAIYSLPPVPKV